MRYLSSISLAIIVHVLLSIVVLMALACTAEPTPTPSLSTEGAIDIVQTHLKTKKVAGNTCWNRLELEGRNIQWWDGYYDSASNRWDIVAGNDIWPRLRYFYWTLDDSTREISSSPTEGVARGNSKRTTINLHMGPQNIELGC